MLHKLLQMLGCRKNRNDDVLRTFQKVLPGKSLEEINDIVRNPPVTLGEIGQVQIHFLLAQARDDEEIGRASCRERV